MPYNASSCPVSFLVNAVDGLNVTAAEALESDLSKHWGASVSYGAVLLVVSLFILFVGARLVRPTLFLASAGSVALLTLAVLPSALDALPSLSDDAACIAVGAVPIATGLVAGLIALCCLNLGFALLGAGAGAGVGVSLYLAVLYRWPLYSVGDTNAMYLGLLVLGALAGAGVMLRYKTEVMIVTTAAAGAVGAAAAGALLLAHADVRFMATFKSDVPQSVYVWAQPAAALLLFLLGAAFQFRSARKRREGPSGLRNHQVPLIVVP